MSRRVALALGSGGARGFAHIGVIEVLGERGFEIVAVAGSSMGALVGGVMAAGRLAEFTEWVTGLKQRDVLRLFDPKWSAPGMITADRLIDHLDAFLTDTQIEDLPIPYTAVATDITARREVWFQRGSLRSAIRASIAIPGLITPVVADGRVLADGGLLNPVPIEPTASVPADLTVAVSLLARRPDHESAAPIRTAAKRPRSAEWRTRLRHAIQLRAGDPAAPATTEAVAEVAEAALPADLRLADVITSSLDAMQDMIARYRMAGLPPDVHIAVPVTAGGVMEFHRAAEMVALGRELATKALDDAGYPR
ncbi:patatin-like phospholipase family protein [Actinoplanes sp. NPDC051513]|uniref:patatin-like phospholipase family protein n=1 Tax=Actinoplanes sp. NPDC051513 TaxID=3363908 RepID=UPI0037A4B84F